MYKTFPELVGNTRVYLDDDSPTNSIAGVLYPNPDGTKMHSVNEAYTARGINRIAGNVAANADELFFNQLQEVGYPERIDTAVGIDSITLTGRFLCQGIELSDYTKIIRIDTGEQYFESFGSLLEVIEITYDDAILGDRRVDNLTPAIEVTVVASSTQVTAMLRHGVQTSADITAARVGDICILSGGSANDGSYLIAGINGDVLALVNTDGSPIQLGPLSLSGFDVNSPPNAFKVVGNGRFLTNPTVHFSFKVPSGYGDFELIVAKASRRPYDLFDPIKTDIRSSANIPEKVMQVIMEMKGFTGASPQWADPVPANLSELAEIGLDKAYDTSNPANPPGFGRYINVDAGSVWLRANDTEWGDNRKAGLSVDYFAGSTDYPTTLDLPTYAGYTNFLLGYRVLREIDGGWNGGGTLGVAGNDIVITGTVDLTDVPSDADSRVPALALVFSAVDSSDDGLYVILTADDGTKTLTVAGMGDQSAVSFVGGVAKVAIFYSQVGMGPSLQTNRSSLLLTDAQNLDQAGFETEAALSLLSSNDRDILRVAPNSDAFSDFMTVSGDNTSPRSSFMVLYSRAAVMTPDVLYPHFVGAFESRTPLYNTTELLFEEPAQGNADDTITLTRAGAGNVDDPAILTILDTRQWTDVFAEVKGFGTIAPLYDSNDGLYQVTAVIPGTKTIQLAEVGFGGAPTFQANAGTVRFFTRDTVIKDKSYAHVTDSPVADGAHVRVRVRRDAPDEIGVDILAPGCMGTGTALNIKTYGDSQLDASLIQILDGSAEVGGALGDTIYGEQEAHTTHRFLHIVNNTDIPSAHPIYVEMNGANPLLNLETNGVHVDIHSAAICRAGVAVTAETGSSALAAFFAKVESGSFARGMLLGIQSGALGGGIEVQNDTALSSIGLDHSVPGTVMRAIYNSKQLLDISTSNNGHEISFGDSTSEDIGTRILAPEPRVIGRGRSEAGYQFNAGEVLQETDCFPFSSGFKTYVERTTPITLNGWKQWGGFEHVTLDGESAVLDVASIGLNPAHLNPNEGFYCGWVIVIQLPGWSLTEQTRVIVDYDPTSNTATFGATLRGTPGGSAPWSYRLQSPTDHAWNRRIGDRYTGSSPAPHVRGTSDHLGSLLLPVQAEPGSLLRGATFRVSGLPKTATGQTDLEFDVSFLRERPYIQDVITSPWNDPSLGTMPDQRHFCQIPRSTGETVLFPTGPYTGDLDGMVTAPLELVSGVSCWLGGLGTATITLLSAGTYNRYRAEFLLASPIAALSAAEKVFEHTQQAVSTAGLSDLNTPFLGDYLWLGDGNNAGLYPITAVSTSGSALRMSFLSEDTLIAPDSTSTVCGVPAIINPGSKVWLAIEPSQTVNLVTRVYPGVAYTLVYNDAVGEGFPVVTADSSPFPLLPP